MATFEDKIIDDDDSKSFCIQTAAPVPGTSHIESRTGPILRRIINNLAGNFDGIEELIGGSLELDPDKYGILISGYPHEVTLDSGKHVQFNIDVSIFPIVDPPQPKKVRRVGKLPRAAY